jgi:hypothetical protein
MVELLGYIGRPGLDQCLKVKMVETEGVEKYFKYGVAAIPKIDNLLAELLLMLSVFWAKRKIKLTTLLSMIF